MKKKALMTLVVIFALLTIVGGTFAIWLGDVDESKDFTINMTDDYLFINSSDLTITSENKTFIPGESVTYSFNLNIKGANADIVFSAFNLQYNGGDKGAFVPLIDNIIKVTLPINKPNVTAGVDGITIPCTVTVGFIGTVDTVDRYYAGRQFKFTILVTATKTATAE